MQGSHTDRLTGSRRARCNGSMVCRAEEDAARHRDEQAALLQVLQAGCKAFLAGSEKLLWVCRAEEDAAKHREEQAAMNLHQHRASKKATLTAEPAAGQLFTSLPCHLSYAGSDYETLMLHLPSLCLLPSLMPARMQPGIWLAVQPPASGSSLYCSDKVSSCSSSICVGACRSPGGQHSGPVA